MVCSYLFINMLQINLNHHYHHRMVRLHHFHLINYLSLRDPFDSRSFHCNPINQYMEDHSHGNYNFHLGMLTFLQLQEINCRASSGGKMIQTIDSFPSTTLLRKPSGEGISKPASSDFFTMTVTKKLFCSGKEVRRV